LSSELRRLITQRLPVLELDAAMHKTHQVPPPDTIRPTVATRGLLVSQIPSLEIDISRHNIVDDITLDIRQSDISAGVAIGE
jgi:hypothetical protein